MSSTSPGVVRRWVFPILRVVVFAAIAVALVKLAFFSGATEGGDGARPTGGVSDPTTSVRTGAIRNDVTLDATVYADAAVPIRSGAAGEIREVQVSAGQQVDGGTVVAIVKRFSDDRSVPVTAGAAGTISALPALVGQQVAIGDVLGQVAPPTFNVSGTIPASVQYRLLSKPAEAQVAISGGPAPFTCTGLTVGVPLAGSGDAASGAGAGSAAGSGSGSGASGSGASTGPTVRCAVPTDVTVFAGLAAKVTIAAGSAQDALLVPATAVEGSGANGTVYVPNPAGKPTAKKVALGIFDGTDVQIVSGLAKGDEILQFVPSKTADEAAAATGTNGMGG
jgi:membrane fusion protein, macrolide-specific efflux system